MNARRTGGFVLATILFGSSPLDCQSAADLIQQGDREHAALNGAGALRHYQAALTLVASSVEALWRASREAIDLGEFDAKGRDSLYRLGEHLGRRAVQADSTSAAAHFVLARALGRRALTLGKRERVKYAAIVRHHALQALRLDSASTGALHVMGVWHAEIMRLNGLERFIAKNLLGAKVFEEASWDQAARLLERATELEPESIVHRLDLARVYRDTGEREKARAQYRVALTLKAAEYNDRHYQQQAERELRELR